MQPTMNALRACAQWLGQCLSIGWKYEDLDWLEKLWWEYHDHAGRLVRK